MYYIYAYIDPRTNKPFYIGKGSGDRKFVHLTESKERSQNKRKYNKIQKIKSLGLDIRIDILEDNINDELLAYSREDEYILKYGRIGYEEHGILTNVIINNIPPDTKGEKNGMYGKKHTQEAKVSMSKNSKGLNAGEENGMFGKKRSQKVKDAVSKANKGRIPWNKGKKRSEEDKKKMREGWANRKANL